MKNRIESSLQKAMDYTAYNALFKKLVEEERTTGAQTQEKIEYTKLNFSRSKRLDKTASVPVDFAEKLQKISNKQTWLVISEPWCGDAAQTLPFLNKMAQLSKNINFKIVLRDENPELMDQFLTNGSRSIPIIIILDDELNVIKHWGPRSKAATKLIDDYLNKNGKIDDTIKEMLQVWYNNDKGVSIIEGISEAIEVLEKIN